jgi:hypothetical protein
VFWLLGAIAGLGVAGYSVFATLSKMGGDLEKAFKKAPDLPPAAFGEGAYGRISGVATSPFALPNVPGLGIPCLAYELVVYQTGSHHGSSEWRIVHRERAGVDIEVAVGDAVVRLDGSSAVLLHGPKHDANHDLRREPGYGLFTSHVRYVPPGAAIQVVGALTREVDEDPSATNDYREVATRYRVVGKRHQPVLLRA